jgi:hypothetical protein
METATLSVDDAISLIDDGSWQNDKSTIQILGQGDFRKVFRFKDLAIKQDHYECKGFGVEGNNKHELNMFYRVSRLHDPAIESLFLPVLAPKRFNNSLYLVFPYVQTVDTYTEEHCLTPYQNRMYKACNNICDDVSEWNTGVLKNTVMLLDYGTRVELGRELPTFFNKEYVQDVKNYCDSLKEKYQL